MLDSNLNNKRYKKMKKKNTKTHKPLGILSGANFNLKKINRNKRLLKEASEGNK